MDSDTLIAIGSLAFILSFVLILPILTYRFEKHMVSHFGEPEAQPQSRHPYTDYGVAGATQAGFLLIGWSRDLRGGVYKVNHALLVSPDRGTMAVVTAGFLLVPIAGTCLYTPTADGRLFYTTNSQYFVQIDVSGNWTNRLAPEASFTRLWEPHQAWLREMMVLPRPFRSGHELEDFRTVRAEHYRSMEQAGLIRYLDASTSRWQFTLNGATRTAIRSLLVGLMRRFTFGRFPKNA